MANTKIIKQKIKSVSSIKKITKTMEMIYFSKMRKSVGEVATISPYIQELKNITSKIGLESLEKNIYFDQPKKTGPEILIIFASNKGLCGSFNTNLFKESKKVLEQNPNIKSAICFGKFAERIAKKLNLQIELSYLTIDKLKVPTQIQKIEKFVRAGFQKKTWVKVHAIYTNFQKMGVYEPKLATLYPLNKNLNSLTQNIFEKQTENILDKKSKQIYLFEPNMDLIIQNLIPKIVNIILFTFLLESRASENSARSFAMKRASDAAADMLSSLKLTFNKVRQDGITAEIAEISAGANVV